MKLPIDDSLWVTNEDMGLLEDCFINDSLPACKPQLVPLEQLDYGEVSLTRDEWFEIVNGISCGQFISHNDLVVKYGLDVFQAMKIWGKQSSIMARLQETKINEIKMNLLTEGYQELQQIYRTGYDPDKINAIDKLIKMVNSEDKKEKVDVNVNLKIENILENVRNKKKVIDI